eukprot:2670953-Ditylum_brightwellii.AAC.1
MDGDIIQCSDKEMLVLDYYSAETIDQSCTIVYANFESIIQMFASTAHEHEFIMSTLKCNSLCGRWFNSSDAVSKEVISIGTQIATPLENEIFDQDLVLKLPPKDRKKSNEPNEPDNSIKYLVSIPNYNNKWFLDQGGHVKVSKGTDAGKVVLFVGMLDMNPVTQQFSQKLPTEKFSGDQ